MTIYDMLIWGGAVLTALGLAGILWCILAVTRARRAGLEDAAMRTTMQRVVAVNMGALAASVLGLMAVIMGIMLR
ncbi:MAG TPA: hypothetical protein PKA35_07145 [Paracoccus solventivorans]|uniref:Uncharacterized protein n=1 Tax=Paracoccus solventivorans TaxID=53463 RepID=A0A832QWI2_9RHOB|nr:hypothetical protein [Paracoccus solventivorans]HHW34349.1 hypothetical protein [Paracoccus solventivorans]HMM08876.1 hypothetical protein [Paracoccus solventivorans]